VQQQLLEHDFQVDTSEISIDVFTHKEKIKEGRKTLDKFWHCTG